MVFIQVKSGKARITEKDRFRLKEWMDASGGRAEIWFFGKRKGVKKEVVV
jgi:hypothetical protein